MATYSKHAPKTVGHTMPGLLAGPPSGGADRLKLQLPLEAGRPSQDLVNPSSETNRRRTFDVESSVVLISSYPRPGKSSAEDSKGVSSYVQNLVPHLSQLLASERRRLIVLTEKSKSEEPVYEENHTLVIRCWKRNALSCFLQILRTLWSQLRKPKVILVQFEFNLFGDAVAMASFPLFLLLLRLSGKTPYLMLHQVLKDLAPLRSHLGLQKKPFQFAIYRMLLPLFYRCLLRLASGVAVHEPVLQERLAEISNKRTAVIPHGCGSFSTRPSYPEARKTLSFEDRDIVLLCFGFLAHYKGSDWIVSEVADYVKQNGNSRFRLVLAGGESPNHAAKPHYQDFLSGLAGLAARCGNHIEITGFIPENRVPLYFCASDLALFPYRTCMSASGPLAIALAFGTPFLLSSPLKPVLESDDFVEARKGVCLSVEDLTFDLKHAALMHKIAALVQDETRLQAMREISSVVGERRSWSVAAKAYQAWIKRNSA